MTNENLDNETIRLLAIEQAIEALSLSMWAGTGDIKTEHQRLAKYHRARFHDPNATPVEKAIDLQVVRLLDPAMPDPLEEC